MFYNMTAMLVSCSCPSILFYICGMIFMDAALVEAQSKFSTMCDKVNLELRIWTFKHRGTYIMTDQTILETKGVTNTNINPK